MNSNGYHGNWSQKPRGSNLQGHSNTHASSIPTIAGSSAIYSTPPGYVHSGYQAALQGNAKQVQQPNFWPQSKDAVIGTTNPFIRAPRLGPGGPIKCSYPGCEYSGYAKSVETHKMDRHLIFPPGYKPPKSAPDGDIGPNMTIQGTGISLNTPDAIAAWIAERKKNWPTAERVAEKQKRKADAIERGQLEGTSNKRIRVDGSRGPESNQRGRGRGRAARGGYRGRGRGSVGGNPNHEFPWAHARPPPQLPAKPQVAKASDLNDHDTSSETDSASDIDPTRDIISSKIGTLDTGEGDTEPEQLENQPPEIAVKAHKKTQSKQPPPKVYNPLVDRPSFFRKLLQPEIRHTVSNLSQAVRFIVDNDMFNGVELKPGDAENVMIKEVGHSESVPDSGIVPSS